MASLKHSQDRTFYVLRDPEDVNQPIVTADEAEALELWASDQKWLAESYNPIEGWSWPLTDEWAELAHRGVAPEPRASRFQTPSAYSAMRVAAE